MFFIYLLVVVVVVVAVVVALSSLLSDFSDQIILVDCVFEFKYLFYPKPLRCSSKCAEANVLDETVNGQGNNTDRWRHITSLKVH